VLRPPDAAIDAEMAAAIDADKGAGARDLDRIETDGPLLEGGESCLDFGATLIILLRQLLGFRVGLLDPAVLGLECVTRGFVLRRERNLLATELTQAVGMAIGELGRNLDPFPAFGADCFHLVFELVGDEAIDERDILEPAAVIALEQVVQKGATRLFVPVEADELGPLVGRPHRAFGQHAADHIGLLGVGLREPLEHLLLARMVAIDGERHELVEGKPVFRVDVEQPRRHGREPQALAHHGDRNEKRGGDLLLGLAFFAQSQESAELVKRMKGLGYASTVLFAR